MVQRPRKRARTTSPCSPPASSWRDLPLDIAGEVLRRLPSYADRICFGATCRSWRTSAREHRAPPPLSPCLCFADGSFRGFFPEDARPFRLPAAAGWLGSCGEWLLYRRHDDGAYLLDLLAVTLAADGEPPAVSRIDRVINGKPPGAAALLRVTLHYLVDSGGELLLVRREVQRSSMVRTQLWQHTAELQDRFAVFRADFQRSRWRRVKTIGDESGGRALFVGRWCSRAVRVAGDRWADQVFFLEDGTGDEWHTRAQRCSLRGSTFGCVRPNELLPLMTTADGQDLDATWIFPREAKL
uniref:Uncharacterized protein n=1 Tax=Oryza barthii TaxID=65489 RepID=A0A0D3F0Z8_9ORYZ